MGRLVVDIPDELDKKFRKKIIDVFGAEKGSLQKAVIEAIKLWLKTRAQPKNPVEGRRRNE